MCYYTWQNLLIRESLTLRKKATQFHGIYRQKSTVILNGRVVLR